MSSPFKSTGLLFVLALNSLSVHALEGSWHVGLGAGVSMLAPDVEGSGFTLEDDQSTTIGINLGIDIHPYITAEVGFTDLGEATLSGGESVEYQALSLGAVAYVLGEKDAFSRQEGVSAYLRFGLNSIDNDSRLNLVESNNTALWLGAGVQWPVSRNFSLRGEITSYDGDAQVAMASLIWRTDGMARSAVSGVSGAGARPMPEPAAVTSASEIENATPTPQNTAPTLQPEPAAPPVKPDNAGPAKPSVVESDMCPPDIALKIRNAQDCALLNGVLDSLVFVQSSDQIDDSGRSVLDSVAGAIQRHPSSVIEIRVHTQRFSDGTDAAELGRLRALAVARYLVGQGVPVSQLRARSFGDTVPINSGNTPAAQQANNRVELRVL